eukprot:scaffold17.g432.t1
MAGLSAHTGAGTAKASRIQVDQTLRRGPDGGRPMAAPARLSRRAGPAAAVRAQPLEAQQATAEPVQQEQQQQQLSLHATLARSIDSVAREEWNACALPPEGGAADEGAGEEANPFVSWEFLHVLEASESAAPHASWFPRHLLLRDDATGQLLGCVPLYLKGHSWAEAYGRLGLGNYYPKLQVCVPFSPVPGPRLLVAVELGVSSLHVTFPTEAEYRQLGGEHGYLQRLGIQERKKAAASGLRIVRLAGDDVKSRHWESFFSCYLNTASRKWGQPYLTSAFFHQLGEAMGDRVLLVAAETPEGAPGRGRLVAGALNLAGSHALFGRNWGCIHGDRYPGLHMELCYYQALEHAIQARALSGGGCVGLDRVEAGAQGEHKIARGFLPHFTYRRGRRGRGRVAHFIAGQQEEGGFGSMVGRFLARERAEMEYTHEVLRREASPYKDGQH